MESSDKIGDDSNADRVTPIDIDVNVPVRPLTLRQRFSTFVCQVRSVHDEELDKCEKKLLSCLKTPYSSRAIELDSSRLIWTLSMATDKDDKTPVVLIHGFGAGSALWMRNLDALAANRPVYAIDLLGFARSSRACLSEDPTSTAEDWAETIELWREKMGISSMYIIAHSLGGYLSSIYALRHPDRVKHLILVEPWGYAEPPKDANGQTVINRPLFIRMVIRLLFTFHPLSILRVAGPLGPGIIRKVRPDLGRKYAPNAEVASYIYKYIHHCNAKTPPAGEAAFKRIVDKNGYPLEPMLRRIGQLPLSVPMTIVLGQDSWIESKTGEHAQQARAAFHNVELADTKIDVRIVEEAGHHLYVEQAEHFNEIINKILDSDDSAS